MQTSRSWTAVTVCLVALFLAWVPGASAEDRHTALAAALVMHSMGPAGTVVSLGPSLSAGELDRIRGKGTGDVTIGDAAGSTVIARIILWDENDSKRTSGVQTVCHNSGIGGKQYNHLVIHSH